VQVLSLMTLHDDRGRRDKDPIKLSPQWGKSDDHVFPPRQNPTRPRILARVEASGSLLHQFFASPPRMRWGKAAMLLLDGEKGRQRMRCVR